MSNKIIGIHFTRALKINIIKNGLLSRSGDEIREKFIKEFGHLFSSEQISEIKRRWSQYFWDGSDGRDFNVFFTFTDSALGSSRTEYLLDFYGGEQVSMCFDKDEDDEISTILQKIGEPLIVKCALNPSNITTYTECPWGMILVSTYHCEMNPLATRFVQEGSISVSVPPEDIVSIISLSNLDNLKTIDRN